MDADGLLVRAEALGFCSYLERRGYPVLLTVPRTQEDFGGEASDDPWGQPLFRPVWRDKEGRTVTATVKIVQVVVAVEADVTVQEFDASQAKKDAASDALREAYGVAKEVVGDFLDWARVLGGQYWLTPSHEAPTAAGLTSLLDPAAGQRFPIGLPVGIVAIGSSIDDALDADGIATVAERAARGLDTPTPEILLADAWHLFVPSGAWEEDTPLDLRRIVRLAAIACETKVKRTLLDKAGREMRGLVEIIVENPREVTQSVPQLLDKTCRETLGTSLKDADRELWKRIDRLFTARNSVAHRGLSPSEDAVRDGLTASRGLFEWLDGLPTGF